MANAPEDRRREAEKAAEFMGSMRGRFILSQALHYAIGVLNAVPEPYREVSNIQDMVFLRDNLFYLFDATLEAAAAQEAAKKAGIARKKASVPEEDADGSQDQLE